MKNKRLTGLLLGSPVFVHCILPEVPKNELPDLLNGTAVFGRQDIM